MQVLAQVLLVLSSKWCSLLRHYSFYNTATHKVFLKLVLYHKFTLNISCWTIKKRTVLFSIQHLNIVREVFFSKAPLPMFLFLGQLKRLKCKQIHLGSHFFISSFSMMWYWNLIRIIRAALTVILFHKTNKFKLRIKLQTKTDVDGIMVFTFYIGDSSGSFKGHFFIHFVSQPLIQMGNCGVRPRIVPGCGGCLRSFQGFLLGWNIVGPSPKSYLYVGLKWTLESIWTFEQPNIHD